MSDYNPCLVIIFNHKYDKNISVLEELYASKFKNIFFLVPFYTGSNSRVIPVYESSFYFQGYIAQGYKTFYRPEFTHYLFIGDDLILNPALDEHNYAHLLGIDSSTSYLPELLPLHNSETVHDTASTTKKKAVQIHWSHTVKGIEFYSNRKGSETNQELPSYEDASQALAKQGVNIEPLTYCNVFGPVLRPATARAAIETVKKIWTYYVSWRHLKVPGHAQQLQLAYPLARGYSDIAIISSQVVQRFCHLCGVFSAMGLFVEIAIPTALALTKGRICTDKDSKLKGTALWLEEIVELEKKYNLNLHAMLHDFPQQQLYYHPVKLSRWR